MRYMVIETYTKGPGPVYERAAERGRMLPPGLEYVDSWVVDDDGLDRCFQLMETDDPSLFEAWIAAWSDLATFEVHPVIDSARAAARVDVRWAGGVDGEQVVAVLGVVSLERGRQSIVDLVVAPSPATSEAGAR